MRELKIIFSVFAVISIVLPCITQPAQASVIGDQMSLSYRVPDVTTVYGDFSSSPDPFTVAVGPSVVGTLEGVTTFTASFSTTGTTDTLTYRLNTALSSPTFNTASFNGPLLTVLSGAAFGPVSSVSGLVDASRILNTGTTLGVNLQGVSYHDGDTVSITFGMSSVPLPDSFPLLGAAIIGLAAFSRRRTRQLAAS